MSILNESSGYPVMYFTGYLNGDGDKVIVSVEEGWSQVKFRSLDEINKLRSEKKNLMLNLGGMCKVFPGRHLIVLDFDNLHKDDIGYFTSFFNKHFSCLVENTQRGIHVFMFLDKRYDLPRKSKLRINRSTNPEDGYIESDVEIYQSGDRRGIIIGVKHNENLKRRVRYVNGKYVNHCVKFEDFMKHLYSLGVNDVNRLVEVLNTDVLTVREKKKTEIDLENTIHHEKYELTIPRFSQFYGKTIYEVDFDYVYDRLLKSVKGTRNAMFYYAVFYVKCLEYIYNNTKYDLGFRKDMYEKLEKSIDMIFEVDETHDKRVCEYILYKHNFRRLKTASNMILKHYISKSLEHANFDVYFYSHKKQGMIKSYYYIHKMRNLLNDIKKDRALLVRKNNKIQFFYTSVDLGDILKDKYYVMYRDGMFYYYAISYTNKQNVIRFINKQPVLPVKYFEIREDLEYRVHTPEGDVDVCQNMFENKLLHIIRVLGYYHNDISDLNIKTTTEFLYNRKLKDLRLYDIYRSHKRIMRMLDFLSSLQNTNEFLDLVGHLLMIYKLKNIREKYFSDVVKTYKKHQERFGSKIYNRPEYYMNMQFILNGKYFMN